MFVRSGTGFKYNVRLSNQVGVVDADYYGNETNEGHMFVSFTNHGTKEWINEASISKMNQGIFMPYYITKDDKLFYEGEILGIENVKSYKNNYVIIIKIGKWRHDRN